MKPSNLKRANEIDLEIYQLKSSIEENEENLKVKKVHEITIYYTISDKNEFGNNKYFHINNKQLQKEYRDKIKSIIKLMNKRMLDLIDKLNKELESL